MLQYLGERTLSERYFKYDVRKYFEQYTSFENKSVLDFGCNHGNFVRYQSHHDYTGIDINKNIIENNKAQYSGCKWIHYDGYNHMYNPSGSEELTLYRDYDVCVSFSVITHMTITETIEIVQKLREHCKELYVTFYSNTNKQALEQICQYRKLNVPDISGNQTYLKTDDYLWSFYDDKYISEILEGEVVDTHFDRRTLMGMQKCLIL